MVTSNISFVLVRFLLSAFLLSLLLVCSVKETYGFEERECLTHTFQLSSLFASSVCNHSTKANERVSTFKIVDKYGPCFQPNRQRAVYPSHTDILRSDRAPIKSIHARLSMDSGLRRDMIEIKSASIPAKDVSAQHVICKRNQCLTVQSLVHMSLFPRLIRSVNMYVVQVMYHQVLPHYASMASDKETAQFLLGSSPKKP
ncbi:hypothetical protein JRO89_XS03G0241300 [Xanthoceras sorbifolium]|uniref:Uncharacterized protein n=1 Tax=Xanthoceras sorbifolium TaxID=99658 RepID=A0ABQ8IBK2_9ROSI|nr:hypothetical protein JRO89_XS03G0241300 [Xanthoceras sorbifolium]